MSQVEEVAARLTQARNELAPITERLLDIEVRLVAAKAADERPAKVSLREFTWNLLDSNTGFTQDYQDLTYVSRRQIGWRRTPLVMV